MLSEVTTKNIALVRLKSHFSTDVDFCCICCGRRQPLIFDNPHHPTHVTIHIITPTVSYITPNKWHTWQQVGDERLSGQSPGDVELAGMAEVQASSPRCV